MHQILVDAASRAIDELFSDTSVSLETTKGDLEVLRDEIDMKIECLDLDIEARDEREADNAALGTD